MHIDVTTDWEAELAHERGRAEALGLTVIAVGENQLGHFAIVESKDGRRVDWAREASGAEALEAVISVAKCFGLTNGKAV